MFAIKSTFLSRLWTRSLAAFFAAALLAASSNQAACQERASKDEAPAKIGQMSLQDAIDETVANLQRIGIALHNHHDTFKTFPPSYYADAQGKPLWSWRVKLLPFLEANDLYKEFHLKEPWDSPHNKRLIEKMPDVYRSPLAKNVPNGATVYLAPVGNDTMFPPGQAINARKITDGLSFTIAIVEADSNQAVVWTKPEDLNFDPAHPGRGLGRHLENHFHAVFADGSIGLIRTTIDAEKLKAFFTIHGGEPNMAADN